MFYNQNKEVIENNDSLKSLFTPKADLDFGIHYEKEEERSNLGEIAIRIIYELA